MSFQRLTERKATSRTPQVVTIVIDDSGSMQSDRKCELVTQGVRDLLMTIKTANQGGGASRFVISIAKFGDSTHELARASKPKDVSHDALVFTGESGGTEMADALAWAHAAIKDAFAYCATIPDYLAESSPNPIVFFFSDGANTGREINSDAARLKAVPFPGGRVDVVAVGVGMTDADFPVMEQIASSPELAANIDPADLADFLAAVGVTLQKGERPKDLVEQYDS